MTSMRAGGVELPSETLDLLLQAQMNPGKQIMKQDTTSLFRDMPTNTEDISLRSDFVN